MFLPLLVCLPPSPLISSHLPYLQVFSILRINALLNPHLHIDAYPLAIAQVDSELTFQYGWSAAVRNEFHCNGGITGVTGNDIKELFVKKKAGNSLSFSFLDLSYVLFSNVLLTSLYPNPFSMFNTSIHPLHSHNNRNHQSICTVFWCELMGQKSYHRLNISRLMPKDLIRQFYNRFIRS